MSANRANASARNKRAGGADINTNGPNPIRGQPGQQMQPQVQPKLSVSDAIGLITLRLGRVEQIVQTIQTSPNDPTSIPEGNDNSALVDKQVFDHIVKRLDILEQKQKNVIVATAPAPTPVPANTSTMPIPMQNLVTIQKHDAFVKDMAKELKEMKELINKPHTLTNEIAELKDMLLKLQAFTMETNNKLVNIIFSESPQFEFLSGEEEVEDCTEVIDDFNMKFFGSVCESASDSVCELVSELVGETNIIEESELTNI